MAQAWRAGGIPAHGNQRSEWDAGCRFGYPNPEHAERERASSGE